MTEPSLTIAPDAGVVCVVERLALGAPEPGPAPDSDKPAPPNPTAAVTPEQLAALPSVRTAARERWVRRPEFLGAVLLRGRDHNHLSVYSRWRAAGADAPGAVTGRTLRDAVEEAGVQTRVLDVRAFAVTWTDGHEQPTVVSVGGTPLVHFGLFTVREGRTDALLDRVRATAPNSLRTPGLQTVNFHTSLDRRRLINLGTWTGFDDFRTLLEQPGFADRDVYWHGLADFANDYFDVVQVISPQSG